MFYEIGVLSLLCLLSISSSAIADNTPKREVNCTAVLIEAAAKRQSGVSEYYFFFVFLVLETEKKIVIFVLNCLYLKCE